MRKFLEIVSGNHVFKTTWTVTENRLIVVAPSLAAGVCFESIVPEISCQKLYIKYDCQDRLL